MLGLFLAVVWFGNHGNLLNTAFGQTASLFSSYQAGNPQTIFTADVTDQAQTAIDKVSPAVVSIYGYKNVPVPQASSQITVPFFNMTVSLPAPTQTEVDAGTGFLINPNGYILTANHVVANGDSSYHVVMQDGTESLAQIVYQDPAADIAIIKIDGRNFPTVTLGDSSELKMRQPILGMGNALGAMNNLASLGEVTALKRDISPSNGSTPGQTIAGLFQSSLQLYPGDSGGPTFDLNGNVIGINDAVAANMRRVSFSIPINQAKAAINTIATTTPSQ